MTTPHKHCEVIKAWADGKQIQYRADTQGVVKDVWKTTENPEWSSFNEYRVKPEKKKGWLNVYGNNYLYTTKEEADHKATMRRSACIEVEWEEGQGL